MGYLQALNLLIRTYKATKGYLPKGIDMLKLKMKARQKVIDSKKVIEFPQGGKDKINPFKPRPTKTEIMMKQEGIPVTIKGKTTTMTPDGILKMLMGKGKGKDVKIGQAPKTTKRKPTVDPKLTQEENIKRIMAENKASAKRLQEKMNKPEKTLGEKLKDYKGDPDAMKDGGKVKKKRKHDDNIDEEDIGEGKSKERFLRVMPEVSDIPRSDGIMELATGGMTNISDTYDNNPTLQSQYPNKQDYLDMFAQQTTTTTPQYATAYQSTGSIDPINPIKPIIPIPQDGGDGGGDPPGPRGNPNFDYEYEALGGLNNPNNVPLTEEEQAIVDKEKSGLMNILSLSPTYKIGRFVFDKAKAGKKQLDDYFKQKAEEKAAKEAALSSLRASMARDAARNAQQDWSGSSDSYSGGMDTSTGNYDDPYDSGQTE